MRELPEPGVGRMFGVLLTAEGRQLRAFSGTQQQPGWAPPIYNPEPGPVPEQLEQLKGQLQELAAQPAFQRLSELESAWQERISAFQLKCRAAKEQRDQLRRQGQNHQGLVLQSQREGTALRQLRGARRAELAPLQQEVGDLQRQILDLKRQRRQLSSQLQGQLHDQLCQRLSAGQPWSLASLFPNGPPTGTGECCAPKLLHQAAAMGLTPIGMAEFWWGPALGERHPGQFYAACKERCQPLIGPLLARIQPVEILYQDAHLLVVVKPPGVLTLPGRHHWNQDSLWLRLRRDFPGILPIHRLDLETSGICLWALSPECQLDLQRQFAERRVEKTYEALLSRQPDQAAGCLDLPLGPDPEQAGRYCLDPAGKPSQTEFNRIEGVRYQFIPRSGRSHQIRVHAAQGLDAPICGDRLYGGGQGPLRLYARALKCLHRGRLLSLQSEPPF